MAKPANSGLLLLVGLALVWTAWAGFGSIGSASHQGDEVSAAQATALASGFARGSGALLPIDLSSEPVRTEVLNSLLLSEPEKQRAMALVDRGERALGWLTLWDNFDEDGDAVSVTAGGFTQQVPLWHAPTRIAVPYIPGQPVLVAGEQDGGGGITVALELSTGPLPLPLLAVGQTVSLPLL